MHASHVCSHEHSFGFPLTMYGMNRMHFDPARLDLLSFVIYNHACFDHLSHKTYAKHAGAKAF